VWLHTLTKEDLIGLDNLMYQSLPIPEPSSVIALIAGLAAAGALQRRRAASSKRSLGRRAVCGQPA
jgi:hypothetical protein